MKIHYWLCFSVLLSLASTAAHPEWEWWRHGFYCGGILALVNYCGDFLEKKLGGETVK